MRYLILLLVLLMLVSCYAPPTKVYIISQPAQPYIESPGQLPVDTYDAKYTKAMRRDPCKVVSQITGAVTIDTEAIDMRMSEADYFANRFACMWEKQNFEEMYGMFASELQSERTLDSFVKIMGHFKVKNRQPYAVQVDRIEFFEEAKVAHVFFSADYRMTTADLEKTREPRMVIHFTDDGWECGDMEDIFLDSCVVHSDCKVDPECRQKCEDIGLQAEVTCVQIVNECDCHCTGDEVGEINFYDLSPR